MKLNSTLLDRIKTWGLSFHGLWKGGSITLPNGATKTCPAPVGGGVVLLMVPDQPAVTRSAGELADDEAAGREWRNYGLISGGRYGSLDPLYGAPGTAAVLLIDAAKVPWLMHITWASAQTYMTVKLRRFGCVKKPWEAEDWLPEFTVSVHPFFNLCLAGKTLITVCQNTTGREFVLGAVSLGGLDDYCRGLIKINVSGTVNPATAHCGLSFSGTLIGGTSFDQGTHTVSEVVTGDFTVTHVTTWSAYDSSINAFTGATVTTTTVVTNDVVVSSESPPVDVWPISWQQTSFMHSSPSVRTHVLSDIRDVTFSLWAGYDNDALKILKAHVVFVDYEAIHTYSYVDHDSYPNADEKLNKYHESYNVKGSCEITYTYGDVQVHHRKSTSEGTSSEVDEPYLPALMSNGDVTQVGMDLGGAAGFMHYVDAGNGSGVFNCPFVFPLTIAGVSWSTPCVAAVNRLGSSPPFTWETIKVAAPSGVETYTTIDKATLAASWQPETNQLAVDSVPICWF